MGFLGTTGVESGEGTRFAPLTTCGSARIGLFGVLLGPANLPFPRCRRERVSPGVPMVGAIGPILGNFTRVPEAHPLSAGLTNARSHHHRPRANVLAVIPAEGTGRAKIEAFSQVATSLAHLAHRYRRRRAAPAPGNQTSGVSLNFSTASLTVNGTYDKAEIGKRRRGERLLSCCG